MPVSKSIAARVREIRERNLAFDDYARELVGLADVDRKSDPRSAPAMDWSEEAERAMRLRNRIADLEKRVRELEMHT